MTDLIKRLEEAEEGSRAFDLWIEGAVSGKTGKLVGTTRNVPAYTTSIDAALALAERVLPDWTAWEVRSRGEKTRFVAEFSRLVAADTEEAATGHAATPALALCIAILKATDTGRE